MSELDQRIYTLGLELMQARQLRDMANMLGSATFRRLLFVAEDKARLLEAQLREACAESPAPSEA